MVDYAPDEEGQTTYTLTAEKSGIRSSLAEGGTFSGYSGASEILDDKGNQIIQVEDLSWTILGVADENGDGRNESLLITTVEPTNDSDGNLIYFYGAEAYNYGVEEVNNICKTLYSNSTYGKARGMTIEDINEALGYGEDIGGNYYYNSRWNATGNLTTKLKELPSWDAIKDNHLTPDGINTEERYGEYLLTGYGYNAYYGILNNGATSSTKEFTEIENEVKLIFGQMTDKTSNYSDYYRYHLASRGLEAYAYRNYCYFGLGYVSRAYASSDDDNFISSQDGYNDGYGYGLRPVVSLKTNIPTISN